MLQKSFLDYVAEKANASSGTTPLQFSTLLQALHRYRIVFGEHTSESILLESRRSKGSDQNLFAERDEGKMIPCWFWKFEDFSMIVEIQSVTITLTTKGYKLQFPDYDLFIEKIT